MPYVAYGSAASGTASNFIPVNRKKLQRQTGKALEEKSPYWTARSVNTALGRIADWRSSVKGRYILVFSVPSSEMMAPLFSRRSLRDDIDNAVFGKTTVDWTHHHCHQAVNSSLRRSPACPPTSPSACNNSRRRGLDTDDCPVCLSSVCSSAYIWQPVQRPCLASGRPSDGR